MLKKILRAKGWVLLSIIVLNILWSPGLGKTIFVDINNPQSNDTNPGTKNKPLRTIQEAVDQAVAGTAIYVREGTYREIVQVKKSGNAEALIVIKPYDNEIVTIKSAGYACFNLQNAAYIEISGFELTNARPDNSVAHGGGIRAFPKDLKEGVFGCRHCIFSDNIIHDNDAGIWIVLSDSNTIKNNIIYSSSEAPIRLKHSPANQVFNNLIYRNGSREAWGICFYASPYTKIFHNTIVEKRGGAVYIYEGTSNLNGAKPGTPDFCIPCSNSEIYDNIGVVVDGAPLVIGSSTTTDRSPVLDQFYGPLNNRYHHNLWFNRDKPNAIVSWGDFGEPGQVFLNIHEFQEKNTDYGTFSIVADPLFVDPLNNDFRLREDSPAKGTASDGKDLGVDFGELPTK